MTCDCYAHPELFSEYARQCLGVALDGVCQCLRTVPTTCFAMGFGASTGQHHDWLL
jgi:hypothetical protein